MDVATKGRQDEGFTLIESVVAMGLFVGVVFLLVSVFNEFLRNDYSTKLFKATLIAENQIQRVEKSKNFESVDSDTIGFHMVQSIKLQGNVVFVDVTVRDAKILKRQYIEFTKVFPVR